jgi:hypothetical protein
MVNARVRTLGPDADEYGDMHGRPEQGLPARLRAS